MRVVHRSSPLSPALSSVVVLAAAVIMILLCVAAVPAQDNPVKAGTVQAAQPATPAAVKALTPEMCLNRWSIGDLRLSPDGNMLAMVVSEPAKPTGTRRTIWTFDLAGRKLRQFTASTKADTSPRWSPDGRTLAFLSSREGSNQVYLIPVEGGEARALTDGKNGVGSFAWSPDGKRLAFETTAPKTEEEEKKEKDKDDARVIGRNEERALLQVIDIESRVVKTLVQGAWRISEFIWTPDGASLILSATDNPQKELFSDKIYRVNAADGKMTLFSGPAGPFGIFKVSPDGMRLAFVGCRGDGPEAHDLFVQPLAGGPAQNLTGRSIDRPIESLEWEDNGRLFVLAAAGFGDAFYSVTLDGRAERSPWTPQMMVGSYAKGKAGLAFVGDSAARLPELWVSGAAGRAEKVSGFNKDWDGIKLIRPDVVRYPSFDKTMIEAALLKPEGTAPGTGWPTVILVHGGPTGAWSDRFQSWGQLLAARGFAVLYPNIRGSTGYGHDFMVVNRKDWGGGDFKDVMAGADWLVKQGVADPKRLGIGGWSYGGYMAAWAVTQTTRFKASVSGAPMTDLVMEYGTENADINAGDTWALGTPYENLPLFLERSPVTHIKKVKTPTLLLCGENDATDPVGQCYEFHRGLRRYGVETEFVVYPREGHGVREEKHQVDVLNRIVGWFEKYLKK